MAGVRHELPYPRLALLSGLQCRADVTEHPVQGCADLADLGALIGVTLGHPVWKLHVAAVQGQLSDLRRGRGDAAQGPQRDPYHRSPRDARSDQAGDRHKDLYHHEGLECGLDTAHRQSDQETVRVSWKRAELGAVVAQSR